MEGGETMNKQSTDVIQHWVKIANENGSMRFDTIGIDNAIITDLLNESYIVIHNDVTGQVSITANALKDFS